MSRYTLQPKAGNPDVVSVAIGWDRPLQTFFVQVFFRTDEDQEDGEPVIWRGTLPGELPSAETAISIIVPYADVPEDLGDKLARDMRSTAGIQDGRHQAAVKRGLFGSIH